MQQREDETLLELVARLERATTRIERIVYGDDDLDVPGLTVRVVQLEDAVRSMRRVRPSPQLWTIGFATFTLAFVVILPETRAVLALSLEAGAAFGATLLCGAYVFFLAGYGWWRL